MASFSWRQENATNLVIEMKIKALSKKKYAKKKGRIGVDVHREGKSYCDCLTRKFRLWLGVKRYGKSETGN